MNNLQIVNDISKAMDVMHNVGVWLEKNGKNSDWWKPGNMNKSYMLQFSEPNEYYVALMNGKPAASMILQESERNQSWKYIDGETPKKSLYVHWLCVHRDYAGKGLSRIMVNNAIDEAKKRGYDRLRLDTEADEKKLCDLYENLGFTRMGTQKEEDRITAYYQIDIV